MPFSTVLFVNQANPLEFEFEAKYEPDEDNASIGSNSGRIINFTDDITAADVLPSNIDRVLCRICLEPSDISYTLSHIQDPAGRLSITDMLRFCFKLNVRL